MLTSANPANSSGNNLFPQNSLFDEGLRIAQQYGMADFAEEIQQLKGDNPNDELSSSKNSNENSLNQSVDNDYADNIPPNSNSRSAKDETENGEKPTMEKVKIEVNGD